MYTAAFDISKITKPVTDVGFIGNNNTKRIEIEYHNIFDDVADNVYSILSEYDNDDPNTAVEVLELLQDYANKLFEWSQDAIGGIIYKLNDESDREWQKHANKMSGYLRHTLETAPVLPLMQDYMRQNVGLIQSMPLRAAERVQELVMENLKTGKHRAEGLVDQIMNIGNVTKNRAKLIARTEVSKMSTGLTMARSEATGIGWYVWKSSHDARVRGSHNLMDQVLISWGDPPSPEELDHKKSYGHYHAGSTFNCRCYPRPLIRMDDVSWPCKVYHNGSITRMRKADFMELSKGQVPMAA
jgi:SPP1 gp7 family putative phage head morphogenesis protein